VPTRCEKFSFFLKKTLFIVDGLSSMTKLLTPPEAGTPVVARRKELVLAYFGTANWNSILSRHDESRIGGMNYRRRSDWVFFLD